MAGAARLTTTAGPPAGSESTGYRDVVRAHLEAWLGRPSGHLDLSEAGDAPLAVDLWPPSKARDFWALCTVGLSDHAMPAARGAAAGDAFRRIELCWALPPNWPMDADGAPRRDRLESAYPLICLEETARFLRVRRRRLEPNQTLSFTHPPEPLARNTAMTSLIFPPAVILAADHEARLEGAARLGGAAREPDIGPDRLIAPDGEAIRILMAMPIYPDELAFAAEHGGAALIERHAARAETFAAHPKRPCVVARRGVWAQLFGERRTKFG